MPFADATQAPSSAIFWLNLKLDLRPEHSMCSLPPTVRFGILSCGGQRNGGSKQEDWELGLRFIGSRGRRGTKDGNLYPSLMTARHPSLPRSHRRSRS